MLTADDLRIRLGFSTDDWTDDDDERAEAVLASSLKVIRSLAGPWRVDQAVADNLEDALDAVDEATMAYAVPMFANPERVMQRRQGSDNSVSFSDSSDAASGLREAKAILARAFPAGVGMTRV